MALTNHGTVIKIPTRTSPAFKLLKRRKNIMTWISISAVSATPAHPYLHPLNVLRFLLHHVLPEIKTIKTILHPHPHHHNLVQPRRPPILLCPLLHNPYYQRRKPSKLSCQRRPMYSGTSMPKMRNFTQRVHFIHANHIPS